MNEAAREKLIRAQMAGVEQVKGRLGEGKALCAIGVLLNWENWRMAHWKDLETRWGVSFSQAVPCPECGERRREANLIAHLNDEHEFDFLTIARKMP